MNRSMHRRLLVSSVLGSLVGFLSVGSLVSLSACSGSDGGSDDGADSGDPSIDTGGRDTRVDPTDTATKGDSGSTSDTSMGTDGGTDTSTGTDGGTDSSTATDSGTKADSSTATDSGTKTDAATDSGTKTDAAVTDSGSAADTAPVDSGPPGAAPMIGPCRIYPPDNPWNTDISSYPLHPSAATFATTMHLTTALHPDWGTFTENYGIPYNTGTGAPPQKMTWTTSWGPGESDKLACADGSSWCYPIPSSCKIEGPSDSHLLFLDTAGAPNNCTLYELWQTVAFSGSGWSAANGAIFHLGTNALRPDGWTSADAAGLPILPGLVRYDEVKAGAIRHAIRFTMDNTYQGYVHPATHAAGLSSSTQPPMGLRLRLKAGIAISSYSTEAQVILTAMKKYGIILADNGSNWYISGEEHDGWAADKGGGDTVMDLIISAFGKIHGSDFEVVDTGPTSTAGL